MMCKIRKHWERVLQENNGMFVMSLGQHESNQLLTNGKLKVVRNCQKMLVNFSYLWLWFTVSWILYLVLQVACVQNNNAWKSYWCRWAFLICMYQIIINLVAFGKKKNILHVLVFKLKKGKRTQNRIFVMDIFLTFHLHQILASLA